MNGNFFAMMSRMKYIERWALMKNTSSENVSEHSLEVGMIAHALAVIGNSRFDKDLNAEKAVTGLGLEEVTVFIEEFLPAYGNTLDELSNSER